MNFDTHLIIIYDGVCGFCNRSVQFILDHTPDDSIRFVSFQSDRAKPFLKKYKIKDMNSIILIESNRCYSKSTAILKIAKNLDSRWRYLYYLIYIPSFLRDTVYSLFSKNRYRIMGKNNSCRLLTPKEKEMFWE